MFVMIAVASFVGYFYCIQHTVVTLCVCVYQADRAFENFQRKKKRDETMNRVCLFKRRHSSMHSMKANAVSSDRIEFPVDVCCASICDYNTSRWIEMDAAHSACCRFQWKSHNYLQLCVYHFSYVYIYLECVAGLITYVCNMRCTCGIRHVFNI